MPIGLIGKKLGMTRVFTEDSGSVPVTVVHVPANSVTQVKTPDSDGYFALQLAAGERKASRLSKPAAGHLKKSGVETCRSLHEFRIGEEELREKGDRVKVNTFNIGEKVNVTADSKGKGFAGVIKRHHFRSQDATHGNSLSHRAAGSIGQCQTPGRVFKGKKMAGHLGDTRVTVKNLKVVKVDEERELLLIEGAVPGARGAEVLVQHLTAVPPVAEEVTEETADAPQDGEVGGDVTEQTAEEPSAQAAAEETSQDAPQDKEAAATDSEDNKGSETEDGKEQK